MESRPDVIDQARTVLDDVDAALVRLSEGTYRSCELCGAVLPEESLSVSPTRRRCDAH